MGWLSKKIFGDSDGERLADETEEWLKSTTSKPKDDKKKPKEGDDAK